MNQRRIIFLSIFGAYHLIAFIFTLVIESQKNDFSLLTGLLGKISWFKYGTFFGLALIVTEVIWTWRESKNVEKEKEIMRHENNLLKAKIYDFTEAAKKAATTVK